MVKEKTTKKKVQDTKKERKRGEIRRFRRRMNIGENREAKELTKIQEIKK